MTLDAVHQTTLLKSILQSAGTPQRAEHEKIYLKSDLDFYGTPVPVIRKTGKTFRKDHPSLTRSELFELVEALWQNPHHEMRSLSLALLDEYGKLLTAEDIDLMEQLLRQMNTWAHVDWIATGAIANLVTRYPLLKQKVLPRWATDENFWVQRAALLSLMKLARQHRQDFELFAQLAAPMLEEQEFFIRKAIGWILREVSKQQPEWTYEFLETHIQQVSGLTLREGAKYLQLEHREALMQLAGKSQSKRSKP